jgi:PAT family beta-lactamase induction signal transducer AmpG
MFWVGVLYFAEGFPFGVFNDVLPVYFRQRGVDLRSIGLLSLLGLAWTLKFIWAPAVDQLRRHRWWMAAMDLGMACVMLQFALWAGLGPWSWALIALFAVFSATNDIAIDAYTIELLDEQELGLANGVRNALYRGGIIGAGLVLMASSWLGWPAAFAAGALALVLIALIMRMAPPERPAPAASRTPVRAEIRRLAGHAPARAAVLVFLLAALWLVDAAARWSAHWDGFWPAAVGFALLLWAAGFLLPRAAPADGGQALREGPVFGALFDLLGRPGIVPVLAFILIFKLGDASMGFMVKPFWVDRGFSAAEIGMVSVNIGLALAIAGGLVGGWYTDRAGIFRALWVLGLFQALSNLGYAAAAYVIAPGTVPGWTERSLIYAASAFESFSGGLGSAAFLSFLMVIVDKRRSAAEYALLSSVFALSRSVAGWAGGLGAQQWGYAPYFLLTFFLSFPAYAFLPAVRRMLQGVAARGAAGGCGDAASPGAAPRA